MPKKKTTKTQKTAEVPRREEDIGGRDWLQKKLWGSESPAPPRSKDDKAARERERKQEQRERRTAKKAHMGESSNLPLQPTAYTAETIKKPPVVTDVDSDAHFGGDMALMTDPEPPSLATNIVRTPRDLSSLRSANHHPWSQLRRRNRRIPPSQCGHHSNHALTSIHAIDHVSPAPTPEQTPTPHTPLEPDSDFKLSLPSLYESLPYNRYNLIRNHAIDVITSAIPYSHKCDVSIFETLWGSIHEPSSRRAFEILVHMPVEPKAFLQILWIIAYPDGPNGRPSVFSPYLVQTVRCFLTNWILAS